MHITSAAQNPWKINEGGLEILRDLVKEEGTCSKSSQKCPQDDAFIIT